MLGKEIEEKIVTESGTLMFNTEKMHSGVYFVTFQSGDFSKMERIVISAK
jgi:hypothetical protein